MQERGWRDSHVKCWMAALVMGACAVGAWLTPGEAFAGGFTFPELGTKAVGRGGAYMLGANGPELIYLNPSLLTRLNGYHLTLDASFHSMDLDYTRAGIDPRTLDENGENGQPFETASDQFGVFPEPMLFMSGDFGLRDFAFGLAIYGPNAMGRREFPKDGGQRFMLLRSELLQVFYSAAAAWRHGGFRIGGTFQYVTLDTKFVTTVSSAFSLFNSDPADEADGDDAITELNLSDSNFSGILGMGYDFDQSWSVGLTYQLPMSFKQQGKADLRFNEESLLGQNNPTLLDDSATFAVDQADILRLSGRYAHIVEGRELFDIELMLTYEFWSRTDQFTITIAGPVQVTTIEQPLPEEIVIEKNWNDTLSLRLGGDYNPNDWLSLRLGGFYETAAVPEATTYLDFASFDRLGVGVGATFALGFMDVDLGYMFIKNFDRTVDEGEIEIVAPLSNPEELQIVNNGDYSTTYQTLSVGVTLHFDEQAILANTPVVNDLP